MNTLLQGKKNIGKLIYVLVIAIVIASVATGIIPVTPAAAHQATVSGDVSCTQDYQQLVTWSVYNDYSTGMTITSINRTVSGLGVGTVVPPTSTSTGTETIAGGTSGTITLTIGTHWPDGFVQTPNPSGSVHLLGSKCFPPPPTKTPTPRPTNTATTQSQPTNTPTTQPTNTFTTQPSNTPTTQPSNTPTTQPSNTPTTQPSNTPTTQPSNTPTTQPSNTPTNTPFVPTFTYTPTNTSIPPSPTYTNTPTDTPFVPTATYTPTNTPVTPSPTYTPTNTPVTPSPTFTPTNTLPVPSATFTPTFTSTPQLSLPVSAYCFSLTNTVFDITITNNGADGYVGFSVDGGSTIHGAFLSFGASELVTVPAGSTSLTLYAKLNAGDAWTGPVSTTALDRSNVCEKDPIHIAFFCTGDSAAPDGWTITNANAFAVDITWQASGGSPSSSGPIHILAGATYTFTTSAISGNMQVFVNGQLLAQGSAGDCSNPPVTLNLTLSAFCAANPVAYNGWWVTNHGSSDASFTWKIQGTSVSGTGTVPANSTIYFLTGVQSVADTLQLSYNGVVQATVPALTTCLKTPPILIPVTGVDRYPLRHSWPYIVGSSALACIGLALLFVGLRRKLKK